MNYNKEIDNLKKEVKSLKRDFWFLLLAIAVDIVRGYLSK